MKIPPQKECEAAAGGKEGRAGVSYEESAGGRKISRLDCLEVK